MLWVIRGRVVQISVMEKQEGELVYVNNSKLRGRTTWEVNLEYVLVRDLRGRKVDETRGYGVKGAMKDMRQRGGSETSVYM